MNLLPQYPSKWQTRSSRTAYKNPWIDVREDAVIRPDGKEGIYGVVQCRLACGVVALTERDEVVLVGQYRYATKRYSWEIIEGGAERGEEPLAASKRELREEAGLEAERWRQLGGEIQLSNCHSDELAYLFVAEGLVQVGAEPEGTEALAIATVPLTEAWARVVSGEMSDAMTVMALQRLWLERCGAIPGCGQP